MTSTSYSPGQFVDRRGKYGQALVGVPKCSASVAAGMLATSAVLVALFIVQCHANNLIKDEACHTQHNSPAVRGAPYGEKPPALCQEQSVVLPRSHCCNGLACQRLGLLRRINRFLRRTSSLSR